MHLEAIGCQPLRLAISARNPHGGSWMTACHAGFSRQFIIDDAFELILGLCAGNLHSVDEKSRCSTNPSLSALLSIFFNVGLIFFACHAGLKLLVIELQSVRVLDEIFLLQL